MAGYPVNPRTSSGHVRRGVSYEPLSAWIMNDIEAPTVGRNCGNSFGRIGRLLRLDEACTQACGDQGDELLRELDESRTSGAVASAYCFDRPGEPRSTASNARCGGGPELRHPPRFS